MANQLHVTFNERGIEHVRKFVLSHSTDCQIIGPDKAGLYRIALFIPYNDAQGRAGIERIECGTLAEVRAALGY